MTKPGSRKAIPVLTAGSGIENSQYVLMAVAGTQAYSCLRRRLCCTSVIHFLDKLARTKVGGGTEVAVEAVHVPSETVEMMIYSTCACPHALARDQI
jgi:hypothetical protein